MLLLVHCRRPSAAAARLILPFPSHAAPLRGAEQSCLPVHRDRQTGNGSNSMNNLKPTAAALLALLAGLSAAPALAGGNTVTLYKNAGCVCCKRWAGAMKRNGFAVSTVEQPDVTPVKDRLGVPKALRSCHTARIGGYLFEGHVPPDLVKKVLKERPKIAGLAVPGMPAAAPGMDIQSASAPYQVVAFDQNGHSTVYARR